MNKRTLLILSILVCLASCEDISLTKIPTAPGVVKETPLIEPPNQAPHEEWVLVPAKAGGTNLPDFYVMKYEAKAIDDRSGHVHPTGDGVKRESSTPVSVASNQPWRSISANDAASECESRGAGYRLISNEEWMAIAKDLEAQPDNWTGNAPGAGCLFSGNSRFFGTVGDGNSITDTCGYNAHVDPDSGDSTKRDIRAKHKLSNGNEIFDLAGNVLEWVDWDKNTPGFQVGPNTRDGNACTLSGELSPSTCPSIADQYMPANPAKITASDYDNDYGIGYFTSYSTPGGAAQRGHYNYYIAGHGAEDGTAGIFALSLVHTPDSVPAGVGESSGFRCVFRN